jgi:homoserine dehydrogenase
MKPIKVGLLGVGNVGGGTFTYWSATRKKSAAAPAAASKSVASRPRTGARQGAHRRQGRVVADPMDIVNDPDIDIVVELIGGYDVAQELVLKASPTASTWSPPTRRCWPCMATRSSPRPRPRA